MPETVGVISTFQSPYRFAHPDMNFDEQAQQAAAGALSTAGMRPDDIDAIVFSLAPTTFMGVADADRWAIDGIFGAGKPIMRVHTGGTTGGSAVHAAYSLVRSGLFRTVMIVGAERISETPDAQKVLNHDLRPVLRARHAAVRRSRTAALLATSATCTGTASPRRSSRACRCGSAATRSSNPIAHLKGEITVEDVMDSPMIAYPLKLFDICPRSSGSAAMIIGDLASALDAYQTARPSSMAIGSRVRHLLDRRPHRAELARTDTSSTGAVAYRARECYRRAGITDPINQIQVAEIYDPFSSRTHRRWSAGLLRGRHGGPAARRKALGHRRRRRRGLPVGRHAMHQPDRRHRAGSRDRRRRSGDGHRRRASRSPMCATRLRPPIGGIAQFLNCTVFGDDLVEGALTCQERTMTPTPARQRPTEEVTLRYDYALGEVAGKFLDGLQAAAHPRHALLEIGDDLSAAAGLLRAQLRDMRRLGRGRP